MGDFTDKIGDRLDHPERVPQEYQHLIADDQQRVKRILEFPVSGTVLDVGCSDGAITRRIGQVWNVNAHGADILPIEQWRFQWDIREPYWLRAVPYDAVYVCEVFEHFIDAEANVALINILAMLKPGGDLIVSVPNRHPHDDYEIGCRSRWQWPDHRSGWTPEKLSRFLGPHFVTIQPVPLYPGERYRDSIWLIVRAKGKKA